MSRGRFTDNRPVTGIQVPCSASIHVDDRGRLTVLSADLGGDELRTLLRTALERLEDHRRWSLEGH